MKISGETFKTRTNWSLNRTCDYSTSNSSGWHMPSLMSLFLRWKCGMLPSFAALIFSSVFERPCHAKESIKWCLFFALLSFLCLHQAEGKPSKNWMRRFICLSNLQMKIGRWIYTFCVVRFQNTKTIHNEKQSTWGKWGYYGVLRMAGWKGATDKRTTVFRVESW